MPSLFPENMRQTAWAKVNLSLAIGCKLPDGYHNVESLVVFADFGDEITCSHTSSHENEHTVNLHIEGVFAQELNTHCAPCDNLLMRVYQMFLPFLRHTYSQGQSLDIVLTKNIPIAAGLGGGSADAGALARLLARHTRQDINQILTPLSALGSDIIACLHARTCLMRAKGEKIIFLPSHKPLYGVLVNPNQALSTAHVFAHFDSQNNASTHTETPSQIQIQSDLLTTALAHSNELQSSAIALMPVINDMLLEIEAQQGCQLARLSGSGATCFGIFNTQENARLASHNIQKGAPKHWVKMARFGDFIY